jgi:hypothetical protein
MATWPGTLPAKPLDEGYSEDVPNTLVRTEMDAGPAKVRRRFTAGVRKFNVSFILTTAQIATLDTFFVTDTNAGADQFTWDHPRTEVTGSFRFISPPKYSSAGGTHWKVSFQLEKLP